MTNDVKNIYNQVKELYDGECIIPLNKRNTKNPRLVPQGNPVCEAGLAMWKDGKFSGNGCTPTEILLSAKSIQRCRLPMPSQKFL